MSTRDEVLTFLRSNGETLRLSFSVRRIGLFGSVVRGTEGHGSDIDILVDLAEPTFDHYMDLKFFLEEHLGRPVDLVLADTLKPRLAPIITREAVYA